MIRKRAKRASSLHGQGRRFNPCSAHHLTSRTSRKNRRKGAKYCSVASSTRNGSKRPKTDRSDYKLGEQWANGPESIPQAWNAFWLSLVAPQSKRKAAPAARQGAAA